MHEAASAPPSIDSAQEQLGHSVAPLQPEEAVSCETEIAPTFTELMRCTWGTHVTVCGQPAKFHQAGMVNERQVVIVLSSHNDILASASWRCEAACGGEQAYYFDYQKAALRIGTPVTAPLLREQASTSLRKGDELLVNGVQATFLCLKRRADELWLTLRATPEQQTAMSEIGAVQIDPREWSDAWTVNWSAGLTVQLFSARLPSFAELAKLRPGVPVTLGADATPGWLQCTQVRDSTKRFVIVKAAPWLNMRQAHSHPLAGGREWIYRIRFEEAGLRVAHDGEAPDSKLA